MQLRCSLRSSSPTLSCTARGDALLDIQVEGAAVTVGVSDRGGGVVRPASRFSWPETGHGLRLVQQMSDHWGVEQVPETPGKRVWFQLVWRADEA